MPGFGRKIDPDEARPVVMLKQNIASFLRPRLRDSYDINAVPATMLVELNSIEADADALAKRITAFIGTFNKDQLLLPCAWRRPRLGLGIAATATPSTTDVQPGKVP